MVGLGGPTSLVATTAAGGQFLAYEPVTLRYKTSRQAEEREPAAVRFNGQTRPVYQLGYFRKELMLPKEQSFTEHGLGSPRIAPKPLRLAWDNFENKATWITGGALGYIAIVTIVVLGFRRADPLQVTKQYFANALAAEVYQVGQGLLCLTTKGLAPGLGTLSSEYELLLNRTHASPFAFLLASEKIYVVYKDQPPTADELSALRKQTSVQILHIRTSDGASARGKERNG